jgi:folate-dependent phosphoribosylglycinamide formyltransferase PurN
MKIVLYTRRNVGLYALSYLIAKGHTVKVITDDYFVHKLAGYLKCELVDLDSMGEFDFFICVHGDKIIGEKYLQEGKFINIHPCLSKYKGHNPIKRFIQNKDIYASVDAHYMTNVVDEGEIICSVPFATGEIKSHAEFYNVGVPFYYICFEKVIEKISK